MSKPYIIEAKAQGSVVASRGSRRSQLAGIIENIATETAVWDTIEIRRVDTSEDTSEEIASLAGRLLNHEDERVRRLAGSVLTQAHDKDDPQGFSKLR